MAQFVLKYISDSHVWRNICYSLSHPPAEPSFSSKTPKLLNYFIRNSVPKISGVQRPQDRRFGTAWRKHVQQEPLFPEKNRFLFNWLMLIQCYKQTKPFILARLDSGVLVVFSSRPMIQNWLSVCIWISIFQLILRHFEYSSAGVTSIHRMRGWCILRHVQWTLCSPSASAPIRKQHHIDWHRHRILDR